MTLYGVQVPGFRPGKAVPESVLINYIGPEQIRSSAVEAVLKKTLPEAMSSVSSDVETQNLNIPLRSCTRVFLIFYPSHESEIDTDNSLSIESLLRD